MSRYSSDIGCSWGVGPVRDGLHRSVADLQARTSMASNRAARRAECGG